MSREPHRPANSPAPPSGGGRAAGPGPASGRKLLGIGPADWACAAALLAITLAMFAKGICCPASIVHEDAAYQFQPFYQFAADEIKAGRFPHWCPYVSCGVPFHASLHGAVLYPLRWPLFWMDYCAGYVASLIFHYFLAALLTYIFLRKVLRCREVAALIGAISFAFGGFAFGHVTHWNYFQAYPWFILTVILFARAVERPGWKGAVLASLPVAIIGLVGAVHILLILGLGLIVWAAGETIVRLVALWHGRPAHASQERPAPAFSSVSSEETEEEEEEEARTHGQDARDTHGQDGHATREGSVAPALWPLAAAVLAGSLGGMIAMAQLCPGLLQSELSTRGKGAMEESQRWEFITEMSADPLPTAERMVVPFLYGNYRLGYWGDGNYHETTFYAGIVPLVAAVVGLCAWRRNRWVPRLAVFGMVMFVLAVGRYLPAFRILYELVPGFDKLRDPARLFLWVQLCIAGLAAIGIDVAVRAGAKDFPRGWRLAGAAAGCAIILALAGGMWAISSLRAPGSWGMQYIRGMDRVDESSRQERAANLDAMARKVIDEKDPVTWAGAGAGAASAVAAAGFFAFPALRKRWFVGALAALLAADLGLASAGMLLYSDIFAPVLGVPDSVRFLQENLGPYRYAAVRGEADGPAGRNRGMQFRIASTFTTDPGIFHTPRQEAILSYVSTNRRIRDLVGEKFIVIDGNLSEANMPLVYRKDGVSIYENRQAFPPAFLARRVQVLPDPEKILAEMAGGRDDLRDVAFVESDLPPLPTPLPDEPAGEVRDFRTVPGEYEMLTDSPGPRQLVLTVTYHPEWTASVDGNGVPINLTDFGFMSVRVPAGPHTVRWRFDPVWFHMGLVGTIAGLVIAASVLGYPLFARKRNIPIAHP